MPSSRGASTGPGRTAPSETPSVATPWAIVVPRHRVVRGDGSLGGYGGGIEFKRRLLRIEGREDLLRAV